MPNLRSTIIIFGDASRDIGSISYGTSEMGLRQVSKVGTG